MNTSVHPSSKLPWSSHHHPTLTPKHPLKISLAVYNVRVHLEDSLLCFHNREENKSIAHSTEFIALQEQWDTEWATIVATASRLDVLFERFCDSLGAGHK